MYSIIATPISTNTNVGSLCYTDIMLCVDSLLLSGAVYRNIYGQGS